MDADSLRVVDLDFREALGAGTIGSGMPYGIARDADTVRVWHVLGTAPAVLGLGCRQNRPVAWPVRPLERREEKRENGNTVRMAIGPGSRSLSGMAAAPDGVILAAHVFTAPGEPGSTELTWVTAAGERTVSVPGDYTLRDSHPRLGVLVSTTDPVPRLFTVSPADLRRLFPED